MDQKGIIAIVIVAILAVAGASVLLMDGKTAPNLENKDFANQDIVPVDNLDNGVVAIGQDSFRWATYFGIADKCVMVDQNDMSNFLGKSFMYYGRALVDIENSATTTPGDDARKYFTHTNCGITSEDVRTILELKPSIVIVPEGFYDDYKNEMRALEESGVNTVAIGYIYTFLDQGTFEIADALERQIDVLSKALGLEERDSN